MALSDDELAQVRAMIEGSGLKPIIKAMADDPNARPALESMLEQFGADVSDLERVLADG